MFLGLLLLWRQLLHTRSRVEDWPEEVDNVGLLLAILIKALEKVSLVIAPKQTLDLIDGTLRELSEELLPVAVLDLEESSQIIGFEKHEADKAAIQLLVAFDFVLKLTALVAVELLFIHRQSESFNDCFEICTE